MQELLLVTPIVWKKGVFQLGVSIWNVPLLTLVIFHANPFKDCLDGAVVPVQFPVPFCFPGWEKCGSFRFPLVDNVVFPGSSFSLHTNWSSQQQNGACFVTARGVQWCARTGVLAPVLLS